MVELKNLTTGYGESVKLLEDFSYTFQDNKVYGILGRSGCGKTTLLRTIAGLIKPVYGEVLINGNKATPYDGVYMMHQAYTCFDWHNCLNNVLIAKTIKGKATPEDVDRARKMLDMVNLSGYEEKYPKQLSGGMRQRLSLARTLFMNPSILLMDEPLSALDESTRGQMQELILESHRKSNNLIILVTHSKDEANKLCDEIVTL